MRLISYITLRRTVGVLGILLPVILVVGTILTGCGGIQESISVYYHTIMRNALVGVLCAVGFFMFSYKGYDKKDNIAGNLAGVFSLGVAFFPTSAYEVTDCIPSVVDNGIINSIHFISATLLFLTLAYFSFYLFTKTNGNITKNKKWRNVIYKTCGVVILVCILTIGVYCLFNLETGFKVVFWFESISLLVFGLSWLVKGETILVD